MAPRVALDAMGGDYAPKEMIRGALASQRDAGVTPLLVGDERAIHECLLAEGAEPERWKIVHAADAVAMDERPVEAVRSRRQTSIRRVAEMLGANEIDAMVTMGNTGAAVAAGVLIVGRLPGVERPGLGVMLPSRGKRTLVIDVGANAEARARHLLQFAIMGCVYQERTQGVANPRVGLLSIGEEESKGNMLVHESARLLDTEALNYVGHIDPAHIFHREADVIVCDGFSGNVVIKAAEATAEFALGELRYEVEKRWAAKLGAQMMLPALRAMRRRTDYAEIGATPLLGLKGLILIGHGRSRSPAVVNALLAADQAVRASLVPTIASGLQASAER